MSQAPAPDAADVERDRSPLTLEERALYLPPPRLTPEQQERASSAIAEIRRLNDEIRAERGSQPYVPPAWKLVNDARNERTRQLG